MWRTAAGTTGRLLQLCFGYYFFYVITGIAVKYFQGSTSKGLPGMNGMEYLVYSTVGGSLVALFVCLGLRWYRLQSNRPAQWGRLRFPSEYYYIVPSGVCTAIVIPTTTLMYSLPISVMVAMVIMRGAIIVVSRIVDAIQIRQGLLKKRVYFEENMGVVFAMLAVGVTIFWTPEFAGRVLGWFGRAAVHEARAASFEFLRSKAAVGILTTYIFAYAIRIYIMNFYKNTRGKGVALDNKGFFAVEQMSAFVTLVVATLLLLAVPAGREGSPVAMFQRAFEAPHDRWSWAIFSGTAFGIVAFFSVFIFMFQGRTATFAGLVNRLTSLVAGTTATLVFHYAFGGRFPSTEDWLALLFIFIAVGFLTVAERKRAAELIAAHEIESPLDSDRVARTRPAQATGD